MTSTTMRVRFAALLLSSPFSIVAADVLVVDKSGACPGSYGQISGAVNAAADGDTIVVKSGFYGPFVIDGKGLVVTADEGANVRITSGIVTPSIHVRNLGHAQTVVLRGMTADTKNGYSSLRASLCEGPLWLEDMSFVSSPLVGPLSVIDPLRAAVQLDTVSNVVFTRCGLFGRYGVVGVVAKDAAPALDVTDGGIATTRVAVFDSELLGGIGHPSSGDGALGVLFDGGPDDELYFSGSTVTGGQGAPGGDGGDGLSFQGVDVHALDTFFTGGAPGVGGSAGQPISGGAITTYGGTARSFSTTSPVREPNLVELDYAGLPGDLVAVFYSVAPQHVLFPVWSSVVVAFTPSPLAGVADASGQLSFSFPAIFGGSAASLTVFSQPIALDAASSQVLWGAPSALTLLADSVCP